MTVDPFGNVYVTGLTDGSLGGPNAGIEDIFLSRFSSDGTLVWTDQIGTANDDIARSVYSDVFGNVYVAGYIRGSLDGIAFGSYDGFLMKYRSAVPEPGLGFMFFVLSIGFVLNGGHNRNRSRNPSTRSEAAPTTQCLSFSGFPFSCVCTYFSSIPQFFKMRLLVLKVPVLVLPVPKMPVLFLVALANKCLSFAGASPIKEMPEEMPVLVLPSLFCPSSKCLSLF